MKILKSGIRRLKAIVRRTTDSRQLRSGSAPASWVRHALTLLAVVWLNVAVQPCVMALAPDSASLTVAATGNPGSGAPAPHHCPHCPPIQARSIPDHHGGADQSAPAMGGHHGHGSAVATGDGDQATPTSCVDTSADCSTFDAVAPDGRNADLKVKASPELVYLAPAWPAVFTRRHSELPPRWRTLSYLPGPPPALNCLYCVYLK